MPTKYNVQITRSAEQDIEDIWLYIYRDSPERATDFILKLEAEIKTLNEYAKRCPVIEESELLGIEYRHLIIGNYRIIFKTDDKYIYIMRVIHSARLLSL